MPAAPINVAKASTRLLEMAAATEDDPELLDAILNELDARAHDLSDPSSGLGVGPS